MPPLTRLSPTPYTHTHTHTYTSYLLSASGCRYGSFLATQLDLVARKCKPPILKPPSRKYISEVSPSKNIDRG